VVRVADGEADVLVPQRADPLDGVGDVKHRAVSLRHPAEILVAQLAHELGLVLEVDVDRGGGVLDRVGDLPHGDGLVALAGEQLPRGIKDPLPRLLPLPLSSLPAAHDVVKYPNDR
jgi:hypothetical protein